MTIEQFEKAKELKAEISKKRRDLDILDAGYDEGTCVTIHVEGVKVTIPYDVKSDMLNILCGYEQKCLTELQREFEEI